MDVEVGNADEEEEEDDEVDEDGGGEDKGTRYEQYMQLRR